MLLKLQSFLLILIVHHLARYFIFRCDVTTEVSNGSEIHVHEVLQVMLHSHDTISTRRLALNLPDLFLPREQDALLAAANQSSAASSTSTRRGRGETIMLHP